MSIILTYRLENQDSRSPWKKRRWQEQKVRYGTMQNCKECDLKTIVEVGEELVGVHGGGHQDEAQAPVSEHKKDAAFQS